MMVEDGCRFLVSRYVYKPVLYIHLDSTFHYPSISIFTLQIFTAHTRVAKKMARVHFVSKAHAICSHSFSSLISAMEHPVLAFSDSMLLADFVGEFDKCIIWAAQSGAANTVDEGKISLDYRTRGPNEFFYRKMVRSNCHCPRVFNTSVTFPMLTFTSLLQYMRVLGILDNAVRSVSFDFQLCTGRLSDPPPIFQTFEDRY